MSSQVRQVTREVDVIYVDNECWEVSAEYCHEGKTYYAATRDGWVEFSEFNCPQFQRDTTRILEKLSKLPAEVKHFLPTRWF